MSIDMTTVKQIMHNNKEVVKIEDSNGNVMWQKNTGTLVTKTYNASAVDSYQTYLSFQYVQNTQINNVANEYGVTADKVSVVSKTLNLRCIRNKSGNNYLQFRTSTSTDTAFSSSGPYTATGVIVADASSLTNITSVYGYSRSTSGSSTFTGFRTNQYWYFSSTLSSSYLEVVYRINN